MGCFNFIGDVLGFGMIRQGLKQNPKLTWISLGSFWAWSFITGAMIVRYAHLGEHPYVFEIMPIVSCLSPIVAVVGVVFFTIGDAFTNIFSEAFQSSFGFMPFDLYKIVGAPHPLLTWGAYVRLNLVGLMSYALLPGLMGRLFSRLMKSIIGSVMPKRKRPATVYADGPRETGDTRVFERFNDGSDEPSFRRERGPDGGGSLPHELAPGELERLPSEQLPNQGFDPSQIDPPPGMKPGDIMVNMGPDSPGQIIRDGVVIHGEGLGSRVDIPGLTPPQSGGSMSLTPNDGEILINEGPGVDHVSAGPAIDDPSLYDAPGSRPGDIMVNMGPDSPGQVIRNGVVIHGEGVGSRVGMPGALDVSDAPPRPMDEPVEWGPVDETSGSEPLDMGAPGARDGDILVNMGPDSRGQVIRDGRVISGEGVDMPDDDELLINRGPDMDGGKPHNVGDMLLNSAADLNAGSGRPRNVGDMLLNSAAELDAQNSRHGIGSLRNAGIGNQLDAAGAGSHEGIGYMPNASGVAVGPGMSSAVSQTQLGGQMSRTALGGVLGQAAVSTTVTGPGSGHVANAAQVALEAGSRSGQLGALSTLGALAGQGQQGMMDAVGSRRRKPRGPKPGWGNEPYRLPPQHQGAPPAPPDFYPEGGGGVNWADLIPGYIGAVVGATGGIAVGGGIYYGDMWAEYHPIRQITHPSGSPDPSCFKMDADYAVNNVVAGGTMAPVGGAAVVAGGGGAPPTPPPQGPQGPYGPQGPQGPQAPQGPPQTVEWTSPDGRNNVLELQPNGKYINILTGGEVDPSDVDTWKQTYVDNLNRTDEWRRRNEYLEKTGQDSMSQELARIKAEGEARQHILDRVGKMERDVFDGKMGLGELMKPGEPGDIMKNLRDIAHQATGRGPIDMNKFNAIGRLYTDTIAGRAMSESQIPEPDSFTDNVIDGGIETVKQLSTCRGPDGKFSKLSLAGRIGADILTMGYAEGLFIPAESINVAKEYVEAGGDSALTGGLMAAGTAAVNLVGGELIGRGIKAAPGIAKVGGELAEEIGENIVKSAASGSSAAKAAVNTSRAVKGAYDAYGRPIVNGIKDGFNQLNVNLGRAPWEPPPGPGRVARPPVTNADVTSRNPTYIDDATTNVGQHVDNMPANTRTGIQQTAEKHGAIIDMRPGNQMTSRRLSEGCHPKGPDIHNKTINGDDIILGANQNAEGLVGHFKPKLPENFHNLPRRDQLRIIDRFQQRHGEFVNNHGAISRNPKFEIRDGVIHNKETGMAYTGDNDVMSVRDAATGRLASAEKTNEVMSDLVGQNIGIEHNAHMNWNYRGQAPHPTGPQVTISGSSNTSGAISGEWRQSVLQQNRGIDQRIIQSHQAGSRDATPLISFGPGRTPRGTFMRGGCLR